VLLSQDPPAAGKNRRHETRMSLSLPVKVQGFKADGSVWEEMGAIENVSASGAAFPVRHLVAKGHVLVVSLPLPKRFRRYDLTEPSYRTYALVRHVEANPDGFRVGVMFLGKSPPRGFDKNPGGLYFLPSDPPAATSGRERRRWQRIDIFVNLKLTRLSPQGSGPQEERTVAENMSRGGARVLTSMAVGKGELLMVEELDGGFRTRAEVRNLYIGPDSIPRLNLQFLDGEAPDRLVGR
jgi:hypothetical protein